MVPSRGKGKQRASATPRRSARNAAIPRDIPDVFQSMLAEADVESSAEDAPPPSKKRRVAHDSGTTQTPKPAKTQAVIEPLSGRSQAKHLQTVEDSSESESSDFEFEDVDLETADGPSTTPEPDGIEDLAISLEPDDVRKRSGQTNRRKPATFAEKAHRLIVHKLHVLCLLGHVKLLNAWCNNAVVQRHLRPLLTAKTISYLNPKPDFSQFQQNRSFVDGLQQAIDSFTAEFRVTARGLRKPQWIVEDDHDVVASEYPDPMDRSDFIQAAKNMEGSQDTGNQLFCALLRAVGVEARLVCSLQPLPFGNVPKAATPRKPVKQRIFATTSNTDESASDEDGALSGSKGMGKVPAIRRRLGQPAFAAKPNPAAMTKKEKSVPKLSYPVYWVEAFNKAHQKWLPVDPIVTHTVNKAFKLEPPSSYDQNQLTYAIAIEHNGAARDVTKRYAKAYNAKTRRFRVESSHEGTRWLKKAMRIFRRRKGPLDRDQVEDAELAQKEAREGLPANVLDFKDHPYYALERHLKRNEVIHPMREVGKVNAGTAAKPRMESVYRRQDVLDCKSADKWYRSGREVKEGEQPLKHVAARSRRQRSIEEEDPAGDGPSNTTALYAPHQTRQYVPPPVERGRVPKNAYGNLDIYVPSMVPPGGTHIRHRLVKDAARLLKVDYADAVTGFQFKGRHGTAIVEGAVVAEQFAEAIQAVIDGFEDAQVEEEPRARSLAALRQWKRFLTGLRIAERVSAYGDGSKGDEEDFDDVQADEPTEAPDIEPGGFFPGVAEEDVLPTAGRFTVGELNVKPRPARQKREAIDDDSDDDLSLVADDYHEPSERYATAGQAPTYESDQGGGFMVEEQEEQKSAGGFLPDADGHGHEDGAFAGGPGGFSTEADHGGRYVTDDPGDDESGGGFLPDEDEDNSEGGSSFVKGARLTEEYGQVGGFPAEEGRGSGDNPDESDTFHTLRAKSEDMVEEVVAIATVPSSGFEVDGANDDSTMANGDTSKMSDSESLPSRDPDDEELEPDWLESD